MKKCLILGNGPSLNELPREVFVSMPSFGVNFCPHRCTYYVCVDHEILTRDHARIYPLAAQAKTAYLSQMEYGTSNLYQLPNVRLVWHDLGVFHRERFFSGLTVVYVALKMAYYAGFEEVHLFGVDHSPTWEHYSPDYYDRPHGVPSAEKMAGAEYHYKLAADVYNKAGRVIINHSHPSKLDAIFQRQKGE